MFAHDRERFFSGSCLTHDQHVRLPSNNGDQSHAQCRVVICNDDSDGRFATFFSRMLCHY